MTSRGMANGSAPAPIAGASARFRAGEIAADEIDVVEGNLATTAGTCAVMGTASTMASMSRDWDDSARQCGDPGGPRRRAARRRGDRQGGGAAGAHRVAVADSSRRGRQRVARAAADRRLDERGAAFDRDRRPAGIIVRPQPPQSDHRRDPVLVDLKPTGQHYMEDLFAAGGVGAVLRELQPLFDLDRRQ